MRLAIISEYYYPHLGGVTEHVHHLARELNNRGHQAFVVTSRLDNSYQDEPFVVRFGRSQLFFSNGSFCRFTVGRNLLKELASFFLKEKIEIVHLHSALTPTLGLIALEAAKKHQIPVVATFHSWFPQSRYFQIFRQPLQKQLDHIKIKIAVSRPVVEAHARYFKADWEIIPNGVDLTYFKTNGYRPFEEIGVGPRLLFLGRFDPRNGFPTILQAMPEIAHNFPRAKLLVAGDGPLGHWYERQVRHLMLENNVTFLGQVKDERPKLYSSSDLYVCPTTRASFGITLLEAMACGTPLVVSDITGFRELINGGSEARLVRPNDVHSWSQTILHLLDHPEERELMRLAALRKAGQFAWPKIVDRVLKAYERAVL
jgi:phosphatidylinositol alpha-mannosyltransferase